MLCFISAHKSSYFEALVTLAQFFPHLQWSMTYPSICSPEINSRIHFGYWSDGTPGHFGVVLQSKECYQCIDDEQCCGSEKCDIIKHECVSTDYLRDEHWHCADGQTCDVTSNTCTGDAVSTESCSSETSEDCKAKSGYCGNPSICPRTVFALELF